MKRIVIWPLVIMLVLSVAVFVTAMLNYDQTRKQAIDNQIGIMDSGYIQLQNVMRQCEFTFASYFSVEPSSGILRNVKEGEKNTEYFEAVVDSVRVLEPLKNANEIVDGIFLYFPNIDPSLNFRGLKQKALHDAISDRMTEEGTIYNQWQLLNAGDEQYIVYFMKSRDACCGCWMRCNYVMRRLGLENNGEWSGEFYIGDRFGANSLKNEEISSAIAEAQVGIESIKDENGKYENYIAQDNGSAQGIYMGLLIPEEGLFGQMPLQHKIVFLTAFIGFVSTILLVLWMNSRISRPVMLLKEAMERYGDGEVEFRLDERRGRTRDEFDLLGHSLNEMMDKVNDLEYRLYETKLKEQETELKYISQQIRPHFILNALNVIYTYNEEEFPLVKKMVMYLVNYFRYIVNLRVDFVQLRYEFRHVENYLKIQRERTQNSIDFFVEWEHTVSDVLIPPLILQTFVENSIKYAVNDKKLFIIVRGMEEDGRLKISISDTGQGFKEETLQSITRFLETRVDEGRLGVGIVNTVERMDILYHGRTELKVYNTETGGACTEIYLPLKRELEDTEPEDTVPEDAEPEDI
ncbi:MAG: histidine kinase [Blautia sp.]|nr:histidine kinase [Blautia sp.]